MHHHAALQVRPTSQGGLGMCAVKFLDEKMKMKVETARLWLAVGVTYAPISVCIVLGLGRNVRMGTQRFARSSGVHIGDW